MKKMDNYWFEDNASRDDKLAIHVLIENTDIGLLVLKQVMGVSYDLNCIEKMLSELKAKSEANEEAEYYVYRVAQQDDFTYLPGLEIQEPVKDYCYLVIRGYAADVADEIIGYFGDKEDAAQYAEYAMSFYEAYGEIHILKAPLDRSFALSEIEVGGWDEDEWQIRFE